MKNLLLLLSLFFLAPGAFGQEVVRPVKVALFVHEERPDGADKFIREELNKVRSVAVVQSGADYELRVVVMPLTEDRACAGFIVVTLVIEKANHSLTVHTGADLAQVTRLAMDGVKKEFFTKRKGDPSALDGHRARKD